MRHLLRFLLCSAFATSCFASPVQVSVNGNDPYGSFQSWAGLSDFSPTSPSITMSDVAPWASSYPIEHGSVPGRSQVDPTTGQWIQTEQPVNGFFSLTLKFGNPPSDPSADLRPSIWFWGPVQGTIDTGRSGSSALSGNIDGTATVAQISNWGGGPYSAANLAQWASEFGVPQAFADLVLDPSRVHLDEGIAGGVMDTLDRTLVIDPPGLGTPSPVPEPTSIAAFLATVAFLGWRRVRTREMA